MLFQPELSPLLRDLASEAPLEVRDTHGNLQYLVTRHEAQILETLHLADAAVNKHGRLKWIRVIGDPSAAYRKMRRQLYSTGRTVAEDSQLVQRHRVPGGSGVTYDFICSRVASYSPEARLTV